MGNSVIIAAAGAGTRMNHKEKKQFIELDGIPILIRTMKKFDEHESVDELIVVTNEDDVDKVRALLKVFKFSKKIKVVAGGTRRQDSVYNALMVVSEPVVMIHDAARPFVTKDIIDRNLRALENSEGVITCVPTKDTIKVVKDDFVIETLDRSTLVNVQTPQTFRTDQLITAYNTINAAVTDDAALAELMGYSIKTVMGSYHNIKITTPEDLYIGEMILRGETCE